MLPAHFFIPTCTCHIVVNILATGGLTCLICKSKAIPVRGRGDLFVQTIGSQMAVNLSDLRTSLTCTNSIVLKSQMNY
jgi:hypothetical protein